MVRGRRYSLTTLLLLGAISVAHGAAEPVATESSASRRELATLLDKSEIALIDWLRIVELSNPSLAAARSVVSARAGRARQAGRQEKQYKISI